ncbi:CvpA family protein [Sediminibacterium soli]|uniref:CvpA family protein n=1 Tax=Sediminibacterium soli TaxID=2698829 RepID=UPI00137B0D65|nr:CvpA family protein [Sediminibacterium soli]NCI47800.1 CvpA family protein [Sediminibacterium soli]
MLIDIVLVILLVFAILKGMHKGFVVALFSFLAIVIGLAAAMKLSAWVAGLLREKAHLDNTWLPFLSFAIVMIGVVLLVRIGARLISGALNLVMLGWLNKLAGMVLYAALFLTVFSVVLFYLSELHMIKPETLRSSQSYPFIKPWGPRAIELFGALIPWFKGMFEELTRFFDSVPAPAGKA